MAKFQVKPLGAPTELNPTEPATCNFNERLNLARGASVWPPRYIGEYLGSLVLQGFIRKFGFSLETFRGGKLAQLTAVDASVTTAFIYEPE